MVERLREFKSKSSAKEWIVSERRNWSAEKEKSISRNIGIGCRSQEKINLKDWRAERDQGSILWNFFGIIHQDECNFSLLNSSWCNLVKNLPYRINPRGILLVGARNLKKQKIQVIFVIKQDLILMEYSWKLK